MLMNYRLLEFNSIKFIFFQKVLSMVWAMDLDDIHGVCGFGKNPLMSKLKEVLTNGNVVTQSPTTVITNSPTQLTTGVITNSPTHVPTSDVNRKCTC
jgi:hypothetical protein